MSKLSALLNPAPNPGPHTSSASPIEPTIVEDHSDGRVDGSPLALARGQSRSPPRLSTLSSPLEALAAAATSSASILSPTESSRTPLVPLEAQQISYHHTLARPTSSHTSPPPPFDFSRASDHTAPVFSAGLEQYHHSTSHEVKARRMSEIADDSSRVLAPLRRSLPDENDLPATTTLPGVQSGGEFKSWHNDPDAPQLHQKSPITEVEPHPDRVHSAPVISQIRQPSPISSHSPVVTTLPVTQREQVGIKAEIMEDSPELPRGSPPDSKPDAALTDDVPAHVGLAKEEPAMTKNIADLKTNDSPRPSPAATEVRYPSASTTPKTQPTKKRAAPKKGTASAVKPAAKKRKLETDSIDGSPSVKRSATPASSRASKTPAPRNRNQSSVTPARSSSVTKQDEDEDMDEDGELFCICRKPDDHTWMIGCDGPCEDWFHGRCVSMNEADGKLIDKWICPNCLVNGHGPTTWKAMCRLENCREPARVGGSKPSKYCSEAHGEEYVRQRALKRELEEKKSSGPTNNKKRRRSNYTDNHGIGEDTLDDEDDQSHLHGGVVRAPDLTILSGDAKDINDFRKLGEGVLSPPRTASLDGTDVEIEDADGQKKEKITYTPEEEIKLVDITTTKETLRTQKALLNDRDSFLGLVKARATTILEELRKKETTKDICGYDTRLSWSDAEFKTWRCGPEGQKAFDDDVLGAPPPADEGGKGTEEGAGGDAVGKGVCQKKRCERHRTWYKLQQQDMAFEKEGVRQALKKLEEEEKGLRDRAMIRCLEGVSEET